MHTSPSLEASLWVSHQLSPSEGASLLLSHPLPAPVPNSLFCLLLPHLSLPPSPQNPHALFLNLSRSLHCLTLMLPLSPLWLSPGGFLRETGAAVWPPEYHFLCSTLEKQLGSQTARVKTIKRSGPPEAREALALPAGTAGPAGDSQAQKTNLE